MSTVIDHDTSTAQDILESIGDATPEQHAAVRTVLERAGAHDLLPYLFGTPYTAGERGQMRTRRIAEQRAASRPAPKPKPKPARAPKPAEPPLPTKHCGRTPAAKALRERIREHARSQGLEVDATSRPNQWLARMYYDAHPEEA